MSTFPHHVKCTVCVPCKECIAGGQAGLTYFLSLIYLRPIFALSHSTRMVYNAVNVANGITRCSNLLHSMVKSACTIGDEDIARPLPLGYISGANKEAHRACQKNSQGWT